MICASPVCRIIVYMLGANLLESLFVLSFNHQNPQLGLIALSLAREDGLRHMVEWSAQEHRDRCASRPLWQSHGRSGLHTWTVCRPQSSKILECAFTKVFDF